MQQLISKADNVTSLLPMLELKYDWKASKNYDVQMINWNTDN